MLDALHSVQPGVLQDVVRIDSTSQSRVEPEIDHSPEPLAVLGEDFRERGLVAVAEAGFRCFELIHRGLLACGENGSM